MRFAPVIGVVGLILIVLAVLMAAPAAVGFHYGETDAAWRFLLSAAVTLGVGVVLRLVGEVGSLTVRDAFGVVAFGWLAAAIFGAIPYVASGAIPSVTDAVFETVSGFTTTGETVLVKVEPYPRSVLLWRSMTQWCGGLGIIMMVTVLLPFMEGSGLQILKAEAGLISQKLRPRMRDTGMVLAAIYAGVTLAEFAALYSPLGAFDAACTSMTTLSTGGFSPRTSSIQDYGSLDVEGVVIVFMLLGGTSFMVHFRFLRGEWGAHMRSEEWRAQMAVVALSTLIIGASLWVAGDGTGLHQARLAGFNAVSAATGTGFTSDDIDAWPGVARFTLLLLAFVGGSVGSTAGALKVRRLLILVKLIAREVRLVLYPNRVIVVRIDGETVDDKVLRKLVGFVALYLLFFIVSSGLLMAMGADYEVALSASASSLGNVGFGLGYADLSWASPFQKMVMAADMIVGRLEIFCILVLFSPTLWRRPETRVAA